MRVALVNRFFWRPGAVPTVVREWAEHLEAAGHEVVVYASDVEAARSTPQRTYVPVRVGKLRIWDWGGLAFAWRLFWALWRGRRRPPDILLSLDSTAYLGACLAGRLLHFPTVMAFQGWIYNPERAKAYDRTVVWTYKFSVRFCARWAPVIACINLEIYNGLRALGVPPERLWLARNCVDLSAWDSGKAGAHKRVALGTGERELLFVGRFSPEKGLEYLLEALPAVVARFPRARLLVLGGEEGEDGKLHELARRLGVADHVVFGGFVPREALREVYARADIMVAPSLAEGHALAPLECLASGTPVIASNVPGLNKTVQDGVNGLLVPPRDPRALAEAICRVLGDAELLDRFSRAARSSVAHFSWPHRVAELEAVCARLSRRTGDGTAAPMLLSR